MQAEAFATYEVTICLILNLVRLRCAAGYECVTSVGLYKLIPHYSDVAPPPLWPKATRHSKQLRRKAYQRGVCVLQSFLTTVLNAEATVRFRR